MLRRDTRPFVDGKYPYRSGLSFIGLLIMPKFKPTSLVLATLQIAATLVCCGLLAACGGGSSPAVVTAITIATAQTSVPVSGVASFTATATDQHGQPLTGIAFTFASTAINVAAVTSSGAIGSVTGMLPGTALITASSGGVISNGVTLTVTPGFLPTGSLAMPRGNATATVLNNGKVLIVGGSANNTSLTDAELYDPATGAFTATGSLIHARNLHFAVLLSNGTVLVGGGFDGTTYLSSAEIYNPTTGTFAATGNLVTARRLPAVAVLQSGKVFIAGGDGPNGALAAAELYNPVDGTFTPTGSLNTARRLTAATVLGTGDVLITGGFGTNSNLSSVETYIVAKGQFFLTGNLQVARNYHTATLLSNGNILIAGGEAPDNSNTSMALANAELFNPFALSPVPAIGNLNTARLGATATLQTNGTVLIAGGDTTNSTGRVPTSSAEIFDPVAGTFSTTGPLDVARGGQTATLLPNGNTLMVGGFNTSGTSQSAEIFEPGSFDPPGGITQILVRGVSVPSGVQATVAPNAHIHFAAVGAVGNVIQQLGPVSWSSSDDTTAQIGNDATNPGMAAPVASPAAAQTVTITGTVGTFSATASLVVRSAGFVSVGNMATDRALHTATELLDGTVLVVEDANGAGAPAPAEKYIPIIGAFEATGAPLVKRLGHTATLLQNGTVLVSGGFAVNSPSVLPLASAELYSPFTGQFTATGSMNQARYDHTATLLNNGMVLISGGMTSDSNFLSSAELYDPATGAFTAANGLNIARGNHTATRLSDGTVLIAGGQGTGGVFIAPGEIYNPVTGEFTETGSVNTPRIAHTATLLPNGAVLLAGGEEASKFGSTSAEIFSPASATFATTGNLVTGRESHTATLLETGLVLITGGFAATSGTITASAELFNPATGTFSATPSMNSVRAEHTATLLDDGSVLLTGGVNGVTDLSSAELY
jgi:large repetitive protein